MHVSPPASEKGIRACVSHPASEKGVHACVSHPASEKGICACGLPPPLPLRKATLHSSPVLGYRRFSLPSPTASEKGHRAFKPGAGVQTVLPSSLPPASEKGHPAFKPVAGVQTVLPSSPLPLRKATVRSSPVLGYRLFSLPPPHPARCWGTDGSPFLPTACSVSFCLSKLFDAPCSLRISVMVVRSSVLTPWYSRCSSKGDRVLRAFRLLLECLQTTTATQLMQSLFSEGETYLSLEIEMKAINSLSTNVETVGNGTLAVSTSFSPIHETIEQQWPSIHPLLPDALCVFLVSLC